MNKELLSKAKDLAAQKHEFSDWYQIECLEESQDYKTEIKANLIDDVAIEYEKLLRIGKTEKQRRDYFAGLSLQALISKMPMLDQKSEFGKQMEEQEMQSVKNDLAKSAWAYADWMLYTETSPTNI